MDAIELLTSQHRVVEDMFEELVQADEEAFAERFKALAGALTQHSILENTHLYPELAAQGMVDDVNEALSEHETVKHMLDEVCRPEQGRDEFVACVVRLARHVEEHVEREEAVLFPRARALLGDERLSQLGVGMKSTLHMWEGFDPDRGKQSEEMASPPWR